MHEEEKGEKKSIVNEIKEKWDQLLVRIENKISLRVLLFIINLSSFLIFLLSLVAQSPITAIVGIIFFFISLIKLI
ncbi:MAG: hypothetical protein EAX96_00045 [Candidatus Lokiarchaeota archaeon]|nr:hypothetical protein [Candidatus Lokiarchaeota archaeon]